MIDDRTCCTLLVLCFLYCVFCLKSVTHHTFILLFYRPCLISFLLVLYPPPIHPLIPHNSTPTLSLSPPLSPSPLFPISHFLPPSIPPSLLPSFSFPSPYSLSFPPLPFPYSLPFPPFPSPPYPRAPPSLSPCCVCTGPKGNTERFSRLSRRKRVLLQPVSLCSVSVSESVSVSLYK